MNALEIKRKVFAYIQAHHMLVPGENIMAGVSGGADSVCLLFLLLEWSSLYGGQVCVTHVNHGLRTEAGIEAAFVETLCRERDIPFFLKEVDVRGIAKARHMSLEEAGRVVRYEAFEEGCGIRDCTKTAVAHNANDRAETMLFHLFRGSGPKGLVSIQPVRGQLIRPLLCLERKEVEAYLKARSQPFCTDASNYSSDYTRNRIRHHLIPTAQKEVSGKAIAHMSQTADLLEETEHFLDKLTRDAMESVLNVSGEIRTLLIKPFCELDIVLQRRVLLSLLQEMVPQGKDIGACHVESLRRLFYREGNTVIHLPKGVIGRRSYGEVILEIPNSPTERTFDGISICPKEITNEGIRIPLWSGGTIACRILMNQKLEKIPENLYTKWFDCDKIKGCLMLRARQQGDYFLMNSQHVLDGVNEAIEVSEAWKKKSLKRYMIDEKIPVEERSQVLLVAEESHILWVMGHRISEYYKVDAQTKRILQITFRADQ
jgi:tRNA(Ile)-lysidine synthase